MSKCISFLFQVVRESVFWYPRYLTIAHMLLKTTNPRLRTIIQVILTASILWVRMRIETKYTESFHAHELKKEKEIGHYQIFVLFAVCVLRLKTNDTVPDKKKHYNTDFFYEEEKNCAKKLCPKNIYFYNNCRILARSLANFYCQ